MHFDLRVISLGAGVQSTAMYWMANEAKILPRPNFAIFADTQQEPKWVYENLQRMIDHGSIPIRVVTKGDIGEAIQNAFDPEKKKRFASIPFWMDKGGKAVPGRRQCTNEYKIRPIQEEIRSILRLKPNERAHPRYRVESWIGISTDEATRIKPSKRPWITHRWPLAEMGMSRADCLRWLLEARHPIPGRSACVMCPYRNASEYAMWRKERPEEFQRAVQFDRLLRSNGTGRGMKREQFVSNLLVPLEELPPAEILQETQLSFINQFENDCEGMCGV